MACKLLLISQNSLGTLSIRFASSMNNMRPHGPEMCCLESRRGGELKSKGQLKKCSLSESIARMFGGNALSCVSISSQETCKSIAGYTAFTADALFNVAQPTSGLQHDNQTCTVLQRQCCFSLRHACNNCHHGVFLLSISASKHHSKTLKLRGCQRS